MNTSPRYIERKSTYSHTVVVADEGALCSEDIAKLENHGFIVIQKKQGKDVTIAVVEEHFQEQGMETDDE